MLDVLTNKETGARFSKVPIINGPGKLSPFTLKIEVSIVLHLLNMIKLSVNETKWSCLLARTRALILYISIWIFDFGPVKLPGLARNGPLNSNGFIILTLKFSYACSYVTSNSPEISRCRCLFLKGVRLIEVSISPSSLRTGQQHVSPNNINMERFTYVASIYANLWDQKKAFTWQKSSTHRGFSWDTNMASVSLFWNTNMAVVTSCENAL